MNVKIAGLNGFGRFGLHLLKYWLDRSDNSSFELKYINDEVLNIDEALKIINTDTAVIFNKYKISISGSNLLILQPNGVKHIIHYSSTKKVEIPWLGKPDIFFECSGNNTVSRDCKLFIKRKTKHVLISATSWDCDQTLVFGYNHEQFDKKNRVISYGSCTVNAYTPLANFINKKYGVYDSDANFIHNIQNYKLKYFNSLNRKFCTLEKSGPNLLRFLNRENFTVNYTVIPFSGVSMLDLRFRLKKNVSRDVFINDLQREIIGGSLKGLYDLNEADIGPEVYNCTTYSAVFIKENIRVLSDNIYLYGYFDNENSVNRYYDLANFICFK